MLLLYPAVFRERFLHVLKALKLVLALPVRLEGVYVEEKCVTVEILQDFGGFLLVSTATHRNIFKEEEELLDIRTTGEGTDRRGSWVGPTPAASTFAFISCDMYVDP